MPKHIGIVSLNYEGTTLCYRSICSEAASLMGEYQHPQITIHSFPLADYMRFVSKLDWKDVASLLLESADKVARTGADFAICPANTTHEAFNLCYLTQRFPASHSRDCRRSRLGEDSKLGIPGPDS
jgi:aspartate racemase